MNGPEYSRDDGKQQLVELLLTDFESAEQREAADNAQGPLGSLVANARVTEEISRRAVSAENQELGHRVDDLVEPTPVTNSFKMFITNAIRRAHAWQTTVDDAVAPERLGLVSGEGIFDPDQAQDIEGQVLRGALFDLMQRQIIVPKTQTGEELDPWLIGPPKEYRDALFTLTLWEADYRERYGEEPFAELEPEAFLAAARRAVIEPDISPGAESDPKE